MTPTSLILFPESTVFKTELAHCYFIAKVITCLETFNLEIRFRFDALL